MDIVIALIAGLLSGITGAMGLGGGTVFLLYLTVFCSVEQITAQGMNILFFLSSAIVAVTVYTIKGVIQYKTVLPMSALACLGALSGAYLIRVIEAEMLSKFFAIFILVMGVRELFSPINRVKKQ